MNQIVIDDYKGIVGLSLAENKTILTNAPYNHPDFNPDVDKKTGYITKSLHDWISPTEQVRLQTASYLKAN